MSDKSSAPISDDALITCVAWRHPQPIGAQGRCIGRTDLAIDRRKARRLAHRIRQAARRHGWAREVSTSPLQRCAMVGRQLRQWGWRHHIDPTLLEMDFGAWDGQPWHAIAQPDIDAWCADFLHGRPGQGESLQAMFERVVQGLIALTKARGGSGPCLIVAHGGWMLVAQWLAQGKPPPTGPSQWPRPPAYGECWALRNAPTAPQPPRLSTSINSGQ